MILDPYNNVHVNRFLMILLMILGLANLIMTFTLQLTKPRKLLRLRKFQIKPNFLRIQ